MKIGDKAFFSFWENSRAVTSANQAKEVLEKVMAIAQMPLELTGNVSQTRELINQFSDNLAPDHVFWQEFAEVVQLAFLAESMAADNLLAHQIHQFRYVISAYQAQWVREYFPAQNDRLSLLTYLKGKKGRRFWRKQFDFDLTESSRLHNKAPKQPILGFSLPINLKIVMGFHTEFILDSQGRFVNEIDPQGINHNGIINGASFNYANQNDKRHYELDIAPIKPHDPAFRKQILANQGNRFSAPLLIKKRQHEQWEHSYFNKKGHYAKAGKSAYQQVKVLRRSFQRELRKLKK